METPKRSPWIWAIPLFSSLTLFADIPDELDKKKYQEAYDTQRRESTRRRSEASKGYREYEQQTAARIKLETERQSKSDSIDTDQRSIEQFNQNLSDLDAQIRKTQTKVDENNRNIVSLTTSLAGIESRIADKRTEISDQAAAIVDAKSEKTKAQTGLDDAFTQLSTAKANITVAQTASDAVETRLNRLLEKGDRLLDELDELQDDRRMFRKRLFDVRKNRERLDEEVKTELKAVQELERSKKTWDDRLEALGRTITLQQELADKAQIGIDEKDRAISAVTNEMMATEKELTRLRDERAELSKGLLEIGKKKEFLEGENKAIPGQIELIKAKSQELEKSYGILKEQKDKLDQEAKALHAGFDLRQGQIDGLAKKVGELEIKISQADKEVGSAAAITKRMKEQSDYLTGEREALKTKQTTVAEQIKAMATQIEGTQKLANAKSQEKDAADDAKKKLEADYQQWGHDVADLNASIVKAEGLISGVQKQITDLSSEIGSLNQENQKLQANRPALVIVAQQTAQLQSAAEGRVAGKDTEIKTIQGNLDKATTELAALIKKRPGTTKPEEDRIKILDVQQKQFTFQMASAKQQRDALQKDAVTAATTHKAKQDAVDASDARSKVIAGTLIEKGKQLDALNTPEFKKSLLALKADQVRRDTFNAQIKTYPDTHKAAQEKVDVLQQALSKLTASVAELTAKKAGLEFELKGLPGAIALKQVEVDTADREWNKAQGAEAGLKKVADDFRAESKKTAEERSRLVLLQPEEKKKVDTADGLVTSKQGEMSKNREGKAGEDRRADQLVSKRAQNDRELADLPHRLEILTDKEKTLRVQYGTQDGLFKGQQARIAILNPQRQTLLDTFNAATRARDAAIGDSTQPQTESDRAGRLIFEKNTAIRQKQKATGELKVRMERLAELADMAQEQITILVLEALPDLESTQDKIKTDLDAAVLALQQARDLAGKWQEYYAVQSRLNDNKALLLKQANDKGDTLNSQLSAIFMEKTENERATDNLVDANASFSKSIVADSTKKTEIGKNIELLNIGIGVARKRIDAVDTEVAAVKLVEEMKKTSYNEADKLAKAEEDKSDAAQMALQTRIANYNAGLAVAIADAKADAGSIKSGSKEGEETGSPEGLTQGQKIGAQDGAASGEKKGRNRDYTAAADAGNRRGLKEGTKAGATTGHTDGYTKGHDEGFDIGKSDGYAQAKEAGRDRGYTEGKKLGHTQEKYDDGLAEGRKSGLAKAIEQAKDQLDLGQAAEEKRVLTSAITVDKTVEIDNSAAEDISPKNDTEPTSVSHIEALGLVLKLGTKVFSAPRQLGSELLESAQVRIDEKLLAARRSVALTLAASLSNLGGAPDRNSDPTEPCTLDPSAVSSPKTTFQYRVYRTDTKAYQHPDFDDAYKKAYDEEYTSKFNSNYLSSYLAKYGEGCRAKFTEAETAALAKAYDDEKTKGDGEGYKAGYDSSYMSSYKTAYELAYPDGKKAGVTEGLPVRKDEGDSIGYQEGVAKGKEAGGNEAYQEGVAVGAKKGLDDNLESEKAKAFEKGKKDFQTELSQKYKLSPDAISASLVDFSDQESVKAGSSVGLSLRIRNFGAKPVPKERLTLEIESPDSIQLYLPTAKATLKELPGDREATYLKVLQGTVIGSYQETGTLKLNIRVFDGRTLLKTIPLKYKVTDTPYQVVGLGDSKGNPFTLSGIKDETATGFIWIKNTTDQATPDGLKIRLVSADSNLKVGQIVDDRVISWIPMDSIAAGETLPVLVTYFIAKPGDYSKVGINVQIKNDKDRPVFKASFLAPFNAP